MILLTILGVVAAIFALQVTVVVGYIFCQSIAAIWRSLTR